MTLLLPRRSYSKVLGWLLHDQTAEDIARPISQLERVVATIIPFDVEKIISGQSSWKPPLDKKSGSKQEVSARTQSAFTKPPVATKSNEPISHYAENITPIGNITWRKRAHVS